LRAQRRYDAETRRLTVILEAAGIAMSVLVGTSAGEPTTAAGSLAAVADMLNLKDTTPSTMYLGLERLGRELAQSERERTAHPQRQAKMEVGIAVLFKPVCPKLKLVRGRALVH
jgi:hypothetical protein